MLARLLDRLEVILEVILEIILKVRTMHRLRATVLRISEVRVNNRVVGTLEVGLLDRL